MEPNELSGRELTKFLTKIGFLWLQYLGCHIVAPEVKVYTWGLRDFENQMDRHWYIDLLGMFTKYIPRDKRVKEEITYKRNGENIIREREKDKELLSRGLEIKISRNDFNNGFIHCGCDYHYLMVPKGLVSKDEVNKGIGIIEVDLDKVQVYKDKLHGYWVSGVELIRKPRRQEIYPDGNEFALSQMAYCNTNYIKRSLQDELGTLC